MEVRAGKNKEIEIIKIKAETQINRVEIEKKIRKTVKRIAKKKASSGKKIKIAKGKRVVY